MSQQNGIRLYEASPILVCGNEHRGEAEVCLLLVVNTAQTSRT